MINPDGTSHSHTVRGWAASLVLLFIAAGYTCAFWGQAATYLPGPLDGWGFGLRRMTGEWNRDSPIKGLGAQLILAFALPAVAMLLCRRRLPSPPCEVESGLGSQMDTSCYSRTPASMTRITHGATASCSGTYHC